MILNTPLSNEDRCLDSSKLNIECGEESCEAFPTNDETFLRKNHAEYVSAMDKTILALEVGEKLSLCYCIIDPTS